MTGLLQHPLDMIPVCPACLEIHKQSPNARQLRNVGCLNPQVHEDNSGNNWPLCVLHQDSGHLQQVRPLPAISLRGRGFIMCWNIRYKRAYTCQKEGCTYAHSKLERKAWNRARKKSTGGAAAMLATRDSSYLLSVDEPKMRNPPNRVTTKSNHLRSYQPPALLSLNRQLLEAPLSYDNYQDKFHTLLYYEEHENERVLKERCDGTYCVTTNPPGVDGTIYGDITGMTSTQVAYARQAASNVKLTLPKGTVNGPCSVNTEAELIIKPPDEQADDVLYFCFATECLWMIERCCQYLLRQSVSFKCPVQFVLKHFYFASLHRSLENLKPHVISKLVPRPEDLDLSLRQIRRLPKSHADSLTLDLEYQLIALNKLVGCSSNAIFLVTGPFGTGKTRLLATAAYNFLKMPNSRVLICTCHTQSADAYINDYFGPMVDQRILGRNDLIRLVAKRNPYAHVKPNYQCFVYNSVDPSTSTVIKQKKLVVTTFISTQQLLEINAPPYTHILIDEGAQSREPEAVAPLSLADEHTKIIIAGDHLQIGPQVLVFGEEAQKHGLGTSLLQRLHKHYGDNAQSTNHLTSILLTNYRCHDMILRLPSALFFESTLQARSTSELHPLCTSAMEFVCTSLDQSTLHNHPDFDETEAVILLEQVKHYVTNWPIAEWGPVDHSKICVISPSATQISKIRQCLRRNPEFSFLRRINALKSYELQGREFIAVFISALEATTATGATMNPTKSICDQYVFNTIITRACSLVVCVGNPFLLLSIESHCYNQKQCWKEYLKRCLEVSSLKIALQCREAPVDSQLRIHALYLKVFGDLQSFLASSHVKVDDTVGDSILLAYKRAFQSLPECRKSEIILGRIANGDRGYTVKEDKGGLSEEEDVEEPIHPNSVDCYLHCDSYRLAWGVPVNPAHDPILIRGIDNRRQVFDGARVQVSLYRDTERSGRVSKIIEQGPKWQHICTVDQYNSIFFNPIDGKNPKFVNLPGLSRNLLLREGNKMTIRKELEVKQHSVCVFDPTSFTNPNDRKDEEEDVELEIPQIKDVIPLSIARQLLFVVWHLSWEKSRRYPLGVVVAALPKGLTFFHAERLLCTQHNISAPNIEITPAIEAELSAAPTVKVDTVNVYNNAIIIEQPDVALTVEECKDGVSQFVLGVHVANVARFLAMDSAIDQLACHRGTSLRNLGPGDKQHPMLPPSTVKKWSFCCGKLMSALSVSCKLQSVNGKAALHPKSTTIAESCVCPNVTLSFDEVQSILEKQFVDGCVIFKGDTKEDKVGLLYSIAKQLCCKRLQCDVSVLGASENEKFPHAHFLVNELMVWTNRTVAEYMLTKPSSFPSILCKQRKPNSGQLASVLSKHKSVLPFHPCVKLLQPQSPPQQVTRPFTVENCCFKKLYDALANGKYMKASEILSVLQNQPQLAVACKELSLTEPDCELVCSSMLQKVSSLNLKPNSYMVSVEDAKIIPYAHHRLHCLSSPITSPLTSYLDIVSQRLLLNALSNNEKLFYYTTEKVASLCKSCQTKQDGAMHCERSISQLNLTLSLAECAQPFMVYVGTVKEEHPGLSDKNTIPKGKLQLVFPDPALHWLDENQCTVSLSSVACGNSRVHFKNGCYESTWSVKVTSFLHSSSTDFYLESSCRISKGDTVGSDGFRMAFMVPSSGDNRNSALVKEVYVVKPNDSVVAIPAKGWNTVEKFVKCPCEATSVPLQKVLDKFPTGTLSIATLLEQTNGFTSAIKNSSMWLYSGKLSIEPYKVLKVWLGASNSMPLLTPTIQLLEIAPFLNICIQHNTTPATCFASPILSNACKIKYNSIEEYVGLWEDVVLAEASVQSIKQAEIKIIHDVKLKWPKLKQPESSLDDVYFVPDGKISLSLSAEFLSFSKDFFSFDVGDLVCVRYKVPMTNRVFKERCSPHGVKDDNGYVVFHLVVYEIGKDVTGVIQDVYLKFASPQTTRISAFMKEYLISHPSCELQLIPLNVSHRRVYKSLRSLLLPTSHLSINEDLVFSIALGRIVPHGASRVDQSQVNYFKQHNREPILKLWPLSGNSKPLNESQLYSISQAMKNKLQLIQGPPGTGKSVTGAHLAYAFVCKNRSRPLVTADGRIKCVLVCGPSNKSVDVVLDLLLQLGDPNLRLLRVYGSSIESKDHVGPYHNKEVFVDISTDQVCRRDHHNYALHWLVRSDSCSLHRKILEMDKEFSRLAKEKKVPSAVSRENYRQVMRQAEDEVFHHGYDIVLCTCNEASSSRVTRNIAPVQVIIDEAAMATEPESMVAVKLASEHVTLIGDHMQLQPVIGYQPAADFGLGVSLFERYASPPQKDAKKLTPGRGRVPVEERHFLRLNVQYRMHWRICELPSKMFYDGELETRYKATEGIQVKRFWPQGRDCPLAFCNIEGREGGATSGNKRSSLLSKSNSDEANKVAQIAEVLHRVKKIPQSEIAVLTPYSSQKDVIISKMQRQGLTGITVQTVTESQGREFGFVILSTVRSQPQRTISNRKAVQPDRKWLYDHLGFVMDKHQICVGITRAKHGLIIVGNKTLLDYDDTWHKLITHYSENGYIKSDRVFPSAEDLRWLQR